MRHCHDRDPRQFTRDSRCLPATRADWILPHIIGVRGSYGLRTRLWLLLRHGQNHVNYFSNIGLINHFLLD